MKVTMVGAGYVGLTTGACLASLGHEVTCVDVDEARITRLKAGEVPIYEPGLRELIDAARQENRLHFSDDPAEACKTAEMVFITVGTPSGPDGDIDLSYVESAARNVANALPPGAVVVLKSTVVAGTTAKIRQIIAVERGKADLRVATNPEFLREGSAVEDFMHPDRVVIGADDAAVAEKLRHLYAPLEERGAPILVTSTTNAELIKYAANAFLALKLGFINEVSDLCEAIGGDVGEVARGIGLDQRIGERFLAPGPGFGGSCFPKDTRAFAATGRRAGAPQALIETLIERNEARKSQLGQRILATLGGGRGKKVAVLGLAFKANTDDTRDAAAKTIIPMLTNAGIRVAVHDPQVPPSDEPAYDGVEWSPCPYAACEGAHAAVILTEWADYAALDLQTLGRTMAGHHLFDYRNLVNPQAALEQGFSYVSLGRAPGGPAKTKRTQGAGAAIPIDVAAASA